jgi:hypothetical protein
MHPSDPVPNQLADLAGRGRHRGRYRSMTAMDQDLPVEVTDRNDLVARKRPFSIGVETG